MPLGPKITDEVKRFIAEVNNEHPDWRAKEVRDEVQSLLRRVNQQAKPDWPGLSIIQVELKKIRDRRSSGEPSGIDGTWSLGSLAKYDIPPEAIPKILEIENIRGGNRPNKPLTIPNMRNLLTIREAKWIGRLHAVTQDIMELAIWSALYAEREKICERAGTENLTGDLDATVRSRYVTIFDYFTWLFQRDWLPDSYKIQVAEAETLKYEKSCDLNLDRPDFTMKGWLIYANMLQWLTMWLSFSEDVPKEVRESHVLGLRQFAKKEGQVKQGEPFKHFSELEVWMESMKHKVKEIAWEEKNERSHSQTVQE